MFCQKCGKEIGDEDMFCAFCGAKVQKNSAPLKEQPNNNYNHNIKYNPNNNIHNEINAYNNRPASNQQMNYNLQSRSFKETVFGKLLVNYFKKPLSVYSLMKNEDTLKVSIGMAIGMPIIYGFFHMLYFISFFKNLMDNLVYYINKLFTNLASSFGSSLGINYSSSDFFRLSDEISKIKDKIQSYISANMSVTDHFFKGIIIMLLIMIVAFVMIEICNATILKSSISQKNIFLISTVSFVPLVISLIISNVVIYLSFVATLLILVLGLIMSLISLFSSVLELNKESRDRAYWTILINNIAFVIIIPFLIKFSTSSAFQTIGNTLKIIDKL